MLRYGSSRVFDAVFRLCGLIACVGFGVLAVVVIADIAFRNLGIAGWPWLNEVTEYLLTISTFFGAPWLLRMNGHVNVDVVVRIVPAAVARVLGHLANASGFAISALLFYVAMGVIIDTRAVGSLVFKNLIFPEWYLQLPMVICFGLCTLEFLGRLVARKSMA